MLLLYRLLKDLHSWSTLYAAGRLMKPVRIIKTGSNNEIRNALLLNRLYAVRTSLLLMSAEFNEVQLYQTIASLSYIGDPRMLIGENPKKVKKLIVIAFYYVLFFYLYFTQIVSLLSSFCYCFAVNRYLHFFCFNEFFTSFLLFSYSTFPTLSSHLF